VALTIGESRDRRVVQAKRLYGVQVLWGLNAVAEDSEIQCSNASAAETAAADRLLMTGNAHGVRKVGHDGAWDLETTH